MARLHRGRTIVRGDAITSEPLDAPIRVLLIEDNPADARLVKEMLRETGAGWVTLTHSRDLTHAVDLLRDQGFNIILLDLSLPDSEGLGTFVRAQAQAQNVPIVVLAGLEDEEMALRAVAAGAQDYLIKGRVDSHLLYHALRCAIERHRMKSQLRTAQGRLQQVLTSSPAVLYATRLTPAGFMSTWVSDNIVRVTGHTVAEANQPTWWIDHVHPDDRGRVLPQMDRLRAETHLSIEYRFRRNDGSYCWIHDDSRLATDDAGQPATVFGAWLDVTDQKQVEAALRETEERFRELAENVREVFFIYEPDTGRALYLSPAYEAVFGHSLEHAYATPSAWLEGVHPDDRAALDPVLHTSTGGDSRSDSIYRVVRPDGALRWIHGRATPVRDALGKVIRVVGIAEDITELRRTQEQLFQSQKIEAVGRLAGGVAHDFNNLLTVIIGHGELLGEDLKEGDPLRESVVEMLHAASRAAGLTKQLLAFSRQQVLDLRVVDLNALVGNMDKMLRRLIGEDVELRSVLSDTLGAVRADAGQIEQVILNLVVNSRDAMPDGGRLMIETSDVELDEAFIASHQPMAAGSYVMLAVTDTGTGMTEGVRHRLFEPFFTTKEPGKGTGLGLATVYGIVKQSGGYIWVYSEVGNGTTFKIYLPRVAETPEALSVPDVVAEPPRGTETVLLVEDEDMVRSLARAALARRGYAVLEAANGREALAICERHRGPIDLLVTDMIMPGMTGRDLALRVILLRPEIKVLYVSGYTDRAIVHQGLLEPGFSFLEKPFAPDSLARKVRKVLDGATELTDPTPLLEVAT
ncbi:MAG: response regulator [Gemmatimonadota bacterium]